MSHILNDCLKISCVIVVLYGDVVNPIFRIPLMIFVKDSPRGLSLVLAYRIPKLIHYRVVLFHTPDSRLTDS